MALVEGRERGHHSVGGVCRGWRGRPSEMGRRRDAPTVAGVGDGEYVCVSSTDGAEGGELRETVNKCRIGERDIIRGRNGCLVDELQNGQAALRV